MPNTDKQKMIRFEINNFEITPHPRGKVLIEERFINNSLMYGALIDTSEYYKGDLDEVMIIPECDILSFNTEDQFSAAVRVAGLFETLQEDMRFYEIITTSMFLDD